MLGFSSLSAAPLADTGKSIKNASASIVAVSTINNVTPATDWYYLSAGYGRSTFGSGDFGRTRIDNPIQAVATITAGSTVIKSNSASISALSSASAFARRVVDKSVMVYGTSQTTINTTANGARIRQSSGVINDVSSVSSPPAIRVVSSGPSMSASCATSVSAVTVIDALSTVSALSASSASALKIREVSANVGATCSTTASGVFTVSANADVSVASLVDISFVRLIKSSALVSSTTSVAAIGREKWEPESVNQQQWSGLASNVIPWSVLSKGSQSWSIVGANSESWTKIPETSETWSKIAA